MKSTHIDRDSGRRVFGGSPETYDQARPGYPPEVYEALADRCCLGPGSRVFEVGAGTGQVTVPLAEAGARVTAIEPDPRLAHLLAEKVEGRFPQVSIDVSTFEDDLLPAAAFDLGVAATSFHWIDLAAGLPKVRRLLAPGGWWAMWWNVFMDAERKDPFYEATTPILEPLGRGPSMGSGGGPPFALDVDRRRDELTGAGLRNVEVEIFHWTVRLDTERVRALYSTFSSIARLADAERKRVLDAISEVANDSFDGIVERPFQTVVYTSQRI